MDQKQIIKEEIEKLLIKIKKLRAELETEEHNLQVWYDMLNSIEKNN